jgi:hypothetical protein
VICPESVHPGGREAKATTGFFILHPSVAMINEVVTYPELEALMRLKRSGISHSGDGAGRVLLIV